MAQCKMAEVTPYIASGRDAHNQPLANHQAPPPDFPVDADPTAKTKHHLKMPEGKATHARHKATLETVCRFRNHCNRIPDHQGGDGIPTFPCAGTERGERRMDADQPGMEPEADARSRKLSKKRKRALSGPETALGSKRATPAADPTAKLPNPEPGSNAVRVLPRPDLARTLPFTPILGQTRQTAGVAPPDRKKEGFGRH